LAHTHGVQTNSRTSNACGLKAAHQNLLASQQKHAETKDRGKRDMYLSVAFSIPGLRYLALMGRTHKALELQHVFHDLDAA